VTVAYPALRRLAAAAFRRRGVPPATAAAAARALCYGDLTGHDTHGVVNLGRIYAPLLDSGLADPAAAPVVERGRGAALLLDGRRGLGLHVAGVAMDLAIDSARRNGVALVAVRNSSHFGCAGYWTARAARRGMVALATSNCGAQRLVRPPGGAAPMLGTNPISLAAPAGPLPPFVLDMSTTVVPTGRIRQAARRGERIPDGWLADDAGAPVNDPAAYDRGDAHLLFLGGGVETGAYKGYGLALAVDLLAGLLGGAAVGPAAPANGEHRPGSRDDDVGHLLVAIDPNALREPGAFAAGAGGMLAALLGCPPAAAGGQVRYPGHLEHETARERLRSGIPVPPAVLEELGRLAAPAGARGAAV
jgi:LDH2 family malate/lactate/ureidoglycolate dehydrogenase